MTLLGFLGAGVGLVDVMERSRLTGFDFGFGLMGNFNLAGFVAGALASECSDVAPTVGEAILMTGIEGLSNCFDLAIDRSAREATTFLCLSNVESFEVLNVCTGITGAGKVGHLIGS